MTERGRLIQKLHRLYNNRIDRDEFGRRKALASEVQAALEGDFLSNLDNHLPTKEDISEKVETKRNSKRHFKR